MKGNHIIKVYDLNVIFPYHTAYPEQIEYMGQLKLSYDASGPCLLELPPGIGDCISIFSLSLAYMHEHKNIGPLVYCVNNVKDADLALKQLKLVVDKRKEMLADDFDNNLRVATLLSKRVSCINEKMYNEPNLALRCIQNTFPWSEHESFCQFYNPKLSDLPAGIMDIEEIDKYFTEQNTCPYFEMRRLCENANVIICTPEDLINPKNGEILREKLPGNAIIVFDDANGIDNVCCNSLSYYFNKDFLSKASTALKSAKDNFKRANAKDSVE